MINKAYLMEKFIEEIKSTECLEVYCELIVRLEIPLERRGWFGLFGQTWFGHLWN